MDAIGVPPSFGRPFDSAASEAAPLRVTSRGDFRTAVTLKGRLETRTYKEPSAIVVAGFQPAIIAFRVGMSLEASRGFAEVRCAAAGTAII